MIDKKIVQEFLEEELNEIDIPKNILFNDLLETFYNFVENDYFEWLKDNFNSFFNCGNPDWKYIKERIKKYLV